jgi:hypothetical protein
MQRRHSPPPVGPGAVLLTFAVRQLGGVPGGDSRQRVAYIGAPYRGAFAWPLQRLYKLGSLTRGTNAPLENGCRSPVAVYALSITMPTGGAGVTPATLWVRFVAGGPVLVIADGAKNPHRFKGSGESLRNKRRERGRENADKIRAWGSIRCVRTRGLDNKPPGRYVGCHLDTFHSVITARRANVGLFLCSLGF